MAKKHFKLLDRTRKMTQKTMEKIDKTKAEYVLLGRDGQRDSAHRIIKDLGIKTIAVRCGYCHMVSYWHIFNHEYFIFQNVQCPNCTYPGELKPAL